MQALISQLIDVLPFFKEYSYKTINCYLEGNSGGLLISNTNGLWSIGREVVSSDKNLKLSKIAIICQLINKQEVKIECNCEEQSTLQTVAKLVAELVASKMRWECESEKKTEKTIVLHCKF